MTTQEEQRTESSYIGIYDDHFDPGEGLSRVEVLAVSAVGIVLDGAAKVIEGTRNLRSKSAELGRGLLSALGSEH